MHWPGGVPQGCSPGFLAKNDMPKKEMSYYRLYLQRLLSEWGEENRVSEDFLDERADAAEEEYENARREGLTVDQAQELAMAVLLNGMSD